MDDPQTPKPGDAPSGFKPRVKAPQLTKAQRRENNKEAKAANVATTPKGPGGTKPSKPSAPTLEKGPRLSDPRISQKPQNNTVAFLRDARSVASTDTDNVLRDLRIFSHFAPPSKALNTKTEIHPAILRLAIQFSEFRIVGANARCIATANALKAVRLKSPLRM